MEGKLSILICRLRSASIEWKKVVSLPATRIWDAAINRPTFREGEAKERGWPILHAHPDQHRSGIHEGCN